VPEKTEHGDVVVVRDGRRFVRTPGGGEIPEEQYLAMVEKAPRPATPVHPPVAELELLAAFVGKVIMGLPSASPGLQRLVIKENELTAAAMDLTSHQAINPSATRSMDPEASRARILAGRLEFMAQVLDLAGPSGPPSAAESGLKQGLRDRVRRTYNAFFGIERADDSDRSSALAIVAAVEMGAAARGDALSKGWPAERAGELGARLARQGVWLCEPGLATKLGAQELTRAIENWSTSKPGPKPGPKQRRAPTDEERDEKLRAARKGSEKWQSLSKLCTSAALAGVEPDTLRKSHARWLAEVEIAAR
jgi:hypothetical protein